MTLPLQRISYISYLTGISLPDISRYVRCRCFVFGFFVVCLLTEMKNFLKYILIGILALTFSDIVKDGVSCDEYVDLNMIQEEFIHVLEQDTFQASSRNFICPPRQTSSLGVPRVQNSGRRQDNSGRYNFEFIRSGKIISARVNHITQGLPQIQYSTSLEPGHKLVSLCRFII